MVNRIKDRQTGEYHDIGGLKCKLVASGELIHNDDFSGYGIGMYLNLVLNANKFYFVKITHPANAMEGCCICLLHCDANIPYWDENEEPKPCKCLLSPNTNNTTSFIIYEASPDILYGGETYEIYELPFALEV